MELELAGLQHKMPGLEKRALCEKEVASLREQLQQEKIQRMIGEQAVLSLQDKVASLEERKAEQDVLLEEKHHTVLTAETYAKEQKIMTQSSTDKVLLLSFRVWMDGCACRVRDRKHERSMVMYMCTCMHDMCAVRFNVQTLQ